MKTVVVNGAFLRYLKRFRSREANNVLSPTHSGYIKHRSTEDQLALLAQAIANAFHEKKKTVAIFYDLAKAFDKVWIEGLLLKVLQSDVTGRVYRWIRCFPTITARVKVNGHLSDSVKVRGVPQHSSSFISTTSPLSSQDMSPTPSMQMTLWSCTEHTTSAAYKLQDAAKKCTNGHKMGDSRLTKSRPNQQFSPSPQQK